MNFVVLFTNMSYVVTGNSHIHITMSYEHHFAILSNNLSWTSQLLVITLVVNFFTCLELSSNCTNLMLQGFFNSDWNLSFDNGLPSSM